MIQVSVDVLKMMLNTSCSRNTSQYKHFCQGSRAGIRGGGWVATPPGTSVHNE